MKPRKGSLRAIGLYFVAKFMLSFIILLFIINFLLGGLKIVDGQLTLGFIEEHKKAEQEMLDEHREKVEALDRAFGHGN